MIGKVKTEEMPLPDVFGLAAAGCIAKVRATQTKRAKSNSLFSSEALTGPIWQYYIP